MGKKAKQQANEPKVITGDGKEPASDEATQAFVEAHADEVEVLGKGMGEGKLKASI